MESASMPPFSHLHPLEKVVARLLDQPITGLNWKNLVDQYALRLIWQRTLSDSGVDGAIAGIVILAVFLILQRLADLSARSMGILVLGGLFLSVFIILFLYQQEKSILEESSNRWTDTGIGFFVLESLLNERLRASLEAVYRADYLLHVSHFPGTPGSAKMRASHHGLEYLARALKSLLKQEDMDTHARWTRHLRARLPPHAHSGLAPQSQEALEQITETLLRVADQLFCIDLALQEVSPSGPTRGNELSPSNLSTLTDAAQALAAAHPILTGSEEQPVESLFS